MYAPKEVDYRRLAVTNHTKTKLVQITQEFLFAYDILSTLWIENISPSPEFNGKDRTMGGEEGGRHQGPSIEATNMMVELSQCHAEKGGAN